MQSVNKQVLVGNLGRDPEIRSTSNGAEVANFSVATTDTWTDKNSDEKREKTEWHNVVVWQPNAVKFIKTYLKKGCSVYIEGQTTHRKYIDKNGVEKNATQVEVKLQGHSVILLSSSRKDEASSRQSAPVPDAPYAETELDDEIPF